MPAGYGYIPIVSADIGPEFSANSPPFENAQLINSLGAFQTLEGRIVYTFDPAGVYELHGDIEDTVAFVDLPSGFQIISIVDVEEWHINPTWWNTVGQSSLYPALFAFSGTVGEIVGMSDWSTSFGWTPLNKLITALTRAALQAVFTMTCDFIVTNGAIDGSNLDCSNGETNQDTIDQFLLPYPANVLVFEWNTFGTGDPLPPVTNPAITAGPAITVTPPPGATVITITPQPSGIPIIVPVTGPGPITTALPPGTTTVTIVPTNPGINSPGPPVTVPIDFDYETDLVIDVAIEATARFVMDPSGIYTLVPNQFHDVLYEHIAGTTTATSQTVSIPRPFGKTSFIPDGDA